MTNREYGFTRWFYGNEISEYGRKHGFVDYRTFANAFDAVLNNSIMEATADIGYWEQESGFVDNSEEIEALEEKIEELEAKIEKAESSYDNAENENDEAYYEGIIEGLEDDKRILQDEIEELEAQQDELPEVFQWFIISDNGARICEEFNEIVFYNSELDIYLWGVTHYGTSWDYVLTDIPCEKDENASA